MTGRPAKELRVSLVLGGARSGKSRFSEELADARNHNKGVLYVATLEPFDGEMRERIRNHREQRPASWRTIEAPFELAAGIQAGLQNEQIILIDCLTLWVNNWLIRESDIEGFEGRTLAEEELTPAEPEDRDYSILEQKLLTEALGLVDWVRQQQRGLVMVSNEIGMGLVPPYLLGRVYRDMIGRLNQRLAASADELFFCSAGIPVEMKSQRFTDY